jgi:hypothetical protein
MASPSLLDYGDPARTSDHIAGPLIATFACVAVWEATRGVRWVNVLLGLWLLAAPWLLGYEQSALINSLACGALVVGLSLVHGTARHRLGGGWSALWRAQPM